MRSPLATIPMLIIRPEGRWHTPGILERSATRAATNPSVKKNTDGPSDITAIVQTGGCLMTSALP